MAKRAEIDVREVVRVIFSGMAAFVAVDFFLLPWLMGRGVAFPTYLYLGLAATVILAIAISLVLRPRPIAKADGGTMHPAE